MVMAIQPSLMAKGVFLGCLTEAYNRLEPKGQLILCLDNLFPEESAVGEVPPSRLNIAASLACRCGLEIVTQAENSDGQGESSSVCPRSNLYTLICRRSSKQLRWRLTGLQSEGFAAFASLFLIVFGHPISQALWEWKYAGGRGCAVVAWRGRQLIAHYGGNLRQVLVYGEATMALQVCDAMVAPDERGVMTKTGAMFQVTAAFLELYQGLAAIPLAFGFPNRRAMRLGERLGLYAEVGALCELRWTALGKRPRLSSRLSFTQGREETDSRIVGKLWEAMARDLVDGVVGVRDWQFLQHRYLNHPERRYSLVLVRRRLTGAPLGLLVLHREEDALALTDLVAPLKNIPLLLVHARRLAGLWGLATLYCWITRQHSFRFVARDTAVRELDISIPTNAWVPQPLQPAQLKNRWWLTMGDTDFL